MRRLKQSVSLFLLFMLLGCSSPLSPQATLVVLSPSRMPLQTKSPQPTLAPKVTVTPSALFSPQPVPTKSQPPVTAAQTPSSQLLLPVGHMRIGQETRGLSVQGEYAYVGLESALAVVDISELSQPRLVTCTEFPDAPEHGEWVSSAHVTSDYAYLGTTWSRLIVIDVSNPREPVPVGSYKDIDTFYSVTVQDHYAYALHGYRWYGSMIVIDISDPANPIKVAEIPGEASDLAIQGTYVYLADKYNRDIHKEYEIEGGLRVVDISDPVHPQELASLLWAQGGLEGIDVNEGYAYATTFDGIGRIVDVSNPATPFEASVCEFGGKAYGILVTGDYALIGGTDEQDNEGLHILDISDPVRPIALDFYKTEFPSHMTLFERDEQLYLAVLHWSGSLRIFRVLVGRPR